MKFGKGLVAGVLALGMVFGVGSSVVPVDAVNLDDGIKTGVGSGKVVDIYLHGVIGNQDSLSKMIRNATGAKKTGKSYIHGMKYSGQKATLICTEGVVFLDKYGMFEGEKNNRVAYDVVFVDNIGTVEKQVTYIKRIVEAMTVYGAKVNLIGHSMGGLSATSYATKYDSKLSTPRIKNLVTIGSPIRGSGKANSLDSFFNMSGYTALPVGSTAYRLASKLKVRPKFALDDLKVGSGAVNSVFSHNKTINPKTDVHSVYGGTKFLGKYKDSSDGVVNKESALYLKKKVKPSKFSSYYAKGVGHTELMHDSLVASKVSSWLK